MTTDQKRELMYSANEREIFLILGTLKVPAKISGYNLEFPVMHADNRYKGVGANIQCEINWKQLERLANGANSCIIYS